VTPPLPSDYFQTGSFQAEGQELLRSYTCLGCGQRLTTWEAFAAHRRECSGRLRSPGALEDSAAFQRPIAALDGAPGDAPLLDAIVEPAGAGEAEPEWDPGADGALTYPLLDGVADP
jgi:hypothetical protein